MWGGAGVACGFKWWMVRVYVEGAVVVLLVVINAVEGELGLFKDCVVLYWNLY